MQCWWLESHLFGEDRSFNWMRVSVALTILFEVLLVALLLTTTRSRIVALTALALFALPGSWIHTVWPIWSGGRVPADFLLVQGWKDQPDLLCNCLIAASMILAYRDRLSYSLFCAAVAICFKESGLMALPLDFALVAAAGNLRKTPATYYCGVATVLGLMAVARWLAGPEVFRFHVHGSTGNWVARYLNAVVPSVILSMDGLSQAVFGLAIFALLARRPKRPLVWLLSLLGALAVSICLTAFQTRSPLGEAYAQFLMSGLVPALLFALWLGLIAVLWKNEVLRRWALAYALFACIAAVPYARDSGALDHVLVLAMSFKAACVGCILLAAWLALRDATSLRHRRFALAVDRSLGGWERHAIS